MSPANFKTILATTITVVSFLCAIFTYLLIVGAKPDNQEDIEKENDEQERYLAEWANRHSRKTR